MLLQLTGQHFVFVWSCPLQIRYQHSEVLCMIYQALATYRGTPRWRCGARYADDCSLPLQNLHAKAGLCEIPWALTNIIAMPKACRNTVENRRSWCGLGTVYGEPTKSRQPTDMLGASSKQPQAGMSPCKVAKEARRTGLLHPARFRQLLASPSL